MHFYSCPSIRASARDGLSFNARVIAGKKSASINVSTVDLVPRTPNFVDGAGSCRKLRHLRRRRVRGSRSPVT
jgi:hypothetical protein